MKHYVGKFRFLFWILFGVVLAAFLFLLFLNFYPVRSEFLNAISRNTKIFDRNGILLYETLHTEQGKTTAVALGELPKYLIDATISVEDERFYEHPGVDVEGIFRAIILNLREGEVVAGGSTITQQLVRNVIGINRDRTLFQKIEESLLALRIERVFSKDEILELYFNKIYYGNLNYGAASASVGYFGKQVENLDLAESAFLAGLPQAPNRYDPFRHKEAALARKDYVLSLMKKRGLISEEEWVQAKTEKLAFEKNLIKVRAPHFVNYVISELEDRFGEQFVSDGLTVKTTLDVALQQKAEEIVRRNLAVLAGKNVTNGSVVVLDPHTGDILAMVGSADYFDASIDGNVNIALRLRQPGSALKPITYVTAFEKGWNGATLLNDEPVRFFTADGTPYLPKNYDYKYHGWVTVRDALANSYNIPAVKTIDFAGVEAVLGKMREMGLTSLDEPADHYGLALTLGDGEVRLLDLASAYMVFANAGLKKEPQAISEIRDMRGEVIFQSEFQAGARVLSEDISFMLTDILSDKNARIPEFGVNNVLEIDRPAAVKTGTTRNFKDNWTVGFSPDFVVGAWVGNSDNSAMHNISGVYGAGPIWHDVMMEIHRGKSKKEFAIPSTVEKKLFCAKEIVPGKACSKMVSEWVPKQGVFSQAEVSQKPKLEIKKPFDLDIFQFKPEVPAEVQQIKFKVEKEASLGQVSWFVNDEEVGRGDEIFWPLQRGNFRIQVKARSKTMDQSDTKNPVGGAIGETIDSNEVVSEPVTISVE